MVKTSERGQVTIFYMNCSVTVKVYIKDTFPTFTKRVSQILKTQLNHSIIFVTRSDIKSLQSDPTLELAKDKYVSSIEQLEMG